MPYEEVDKLGSNYSTLKNNFSTDVCTKDAKFLTELSKFPKNVKMKI